MPTIQEQVSHNLTLIDQAASEGRAFRVTMHDGRLVVETSPKELLEKDQWKRSHLRNEVAERQLSEMVISVLDDSESSLSLRKQIFDGAKARRYTFLSNKRAKAIAKNEALMLSPFQKKEPVPTRPLPKRKVRLLDAMESNGPIKQLSGNPGRRPFADAMKSNGPIKVIQKSTPQEIPPVTFTPPTITVTPPAEEPIPDDPTPVTLREQTPYVPVFQVDGPPGQTNQPERPVIFPKSPLLMLEEARQELEAKLPTANLADADSFLWLYYTCEFLEKDTSDSADELKAQLEQNFAAAGLSSYFNKRQTEQKWQAVRALKTDMSPEAFSQCIDEISQISTPMRFKLTQELVRDIDQLSFRKILYPDGDPTIRVDAFQLEFLEQVKDTDELMEELGFEIDDPDESDFPLEAMAKLVDVREKLKDELLTYSTEYEPFAQLVDQLKEIDPVAIRDKLNEGKTPAGEELQAIIAAKKQKLEVARQLGKKWGDSLLLDGRNWPDDNARQTLSKLYDLASLNSPAIDAHLNRWLLDKHQEAEYHPQVVIDGSDLHGLLAALTQVEAGADVTLLLSAEPLFAPTAILRLDPQWLETLRFYLGEPFDALFNSNSGRLDPDGFGEITAAPLYQALWKQALEMTKLEPSPLKMVSNARVVDIEAPDQQDGKYLVHLEHQSEQNTHRNKVPADLLINAGATLNAASVGYLETETLDNRFHEAAKEEQSRPPVRIACRGAFSLPEPAIALPAKSPFNVTVTDPSFSDTLVENMRQRFGHQAPALSGVRDHVQAGIRLNLIERKEGFEDESQYTLTEELQKLHLSIKNKPLQLKTVHIENRESIQMDMELPAPMCQFLQAAEAYLQHHQATPEESAAIRQQILAVWFETVAIQIELPKRGIQPEHLRQASLSTFSPEKTTLEPAVETLKSHNSILTLTAVGPAAFKHPLSPEAGQTSAREQVFYCQELTEKLSERHTPEGHLKDSEDLLEDTEDMEQKYLTLQRFVIGSD